MAENEEKVLELEGRRQLIVEELNWFAVTQDNFFDEEYHNNLLDEIDDAILHCNNNIAQSREKTKVFDAGPCYVLIDGTLNKIGVEREKYFGGCFVGNDCHKILRDDNLSLLCDSLPITVNEKTFSGDVYDFAVENCEKFKILFSKFSKCHRIFNSARHLEQLEINTLKLDIEGFMFYLRSNFPDITIIPKMHMLEDHIIPFISKSGAGCGFFGEQGGESIHASINTLKRNYCNIKKDTDRLKYVMNCHLASTNPTIRVRRVSKKKRNLQK